MNTNICRTSPCARRVEERKGRFSSVHILEHILSVANYGRRWSSFHVRRTELNHLEWKRTSGIIKFIYSPLSLQKHGRRRVQWYLQLL